LLSSIAAVALVAMVAPSGSVTAAPKKKAKIAKTELVKVDNDRLAKLPIKGVSKAEVKKEVKRLNAQLDRKKKRKGGYKVGDKRYWLALDDQLGFYYPKKFKLRGQDRHIEIWVAADKDDTSRGLWYPEGDCRNDYPDRIKVTNAQIEYFMDEFEGNMYPTESDFFSVPPRRGGQDQLMSDFFPDLVKPNDYRDKGAGRRIVTLVDNVRDDQFYDMDDSQDLGRIGGFFSSTLNELHDRNVMSIDSWNWKYSTGANPPSNPVPGNVCESVVGQPFSYEGTFAHEYQHLLMYYEDPAEFSWINEGLSVFTEELVGYSEPAAPMTDVQWDAFMQCLYGNWDIPSDYNPNPKDVGGPENSLTLWGDQDVQDSDQIFCDYGAGGSFIQHAVQQFGPEAAQILHRGDTQGLDNVQEMLTQLGSADTPLDLVHRWNAMLALDGVIDAGATLTGGDAADYQVDALNGMIDWEDSDAYDLPGAPPNGADYVRARDGEGNFLSAGDITEISFDGGSELEPVDVEWTTATPEGADGEVLYSGADDNLDRSIVREVTVPADNATLTFDHLHDMEYYWDYGFVQVSTDGGETYTSLANENTYAESDPGADPRVINNLPGFTGESGVPDEEELADPETPSWVTETFDLSAYAGQTIHLAFYYVTDAAVIDDGWWIDNVMVGDTLVSDGSDLDQWQTFTQVNPVDVEGFTVQLVAWNDALTEAWIGQLPLDENFDGTLSGAELTAAIGDSAELVGILVTYDESTELIPDYAPYELSVNGVTQPYDS
jgi:hypothetical protein